VLHIDTGMRRLGLSASEVAKLDKDLLRSIDLRYVMSHLACADEPAHEMNRRQLKDFAALTDALGVPSRKSFANSSGIFLGQDFHFDQARPGCALYGINPQPENKNPMRQPVALKARILQIREGVAGETVGYSATYKLKQPEKLATISAGYADGLLRSTTERGMVYVGGRACPLRGRVSMDTVVADISDVPEKDIDGTAEILGAHRTADDAAREAGTIGYEILTGLGRRYERIYRDAS
jgi:alanine racemase